MVNNIKNDQEALETILKTKDTKALAEHLQAGMADYLNTDTYKEFLKFVNQFHNYSYRNQLLIHRQAPHAKHVASFKKWKELDNPIKKGAKSIKIWAPFKYWSKAEKDENGTEKERVQMTGFRLVSVFDESQTTNPEKIPNQIVETVGDFSHQESFEKVMAALQKLTTARVNIGPMINQSQTAKGYYEPSSNQIVLRENMGQNQTVAVAVHEIVHSRLHQKNNYQFGSPEYARQEFEAESIAYIVSTHLGIEAAQSSFGYLYSWNGEDKDLSSLQESLTLITTEAKEIITKIDHQLVEINQNTKKNDDILGEYRTESETKTQAPKEKMSGLQR